MMNAMSTDPTQHASEIRWPDADSGPYLVRVGWRLLGERWECVELSCSYVDEARPLHTKDMRALRLPAILRQAAGELRRELAGQREELRATMQPTSSRAEYRKQLAAQRRADEALQAAAPRRGRPATPLAELQQVATIYERAFRAHRPPTMAVAETLQISHSAAAKRVAVCRQRGLLGEAEQGKAGVGLLMGRGDAASLARQIARDEFMAQRRAEDEAGQS